MSEAFLGEIRIVGFNWAPRGWAGCDGQLMPISQNSALFSLLGTQFGGDGKTTFAIPDLRGRVPLHQGRGTGLLDRYIGEKGGAEYVTLTTSQIPPHTHAANASSQQATQRDPGNAVWAKEATGQTAVYSSQTPDTQMNAAALASVGGGQPHDNMQPYLVVNFVIALQGIFPSRP